MSCCNRDCSVGPAENVRPSTRFVEPLYVLAACVPNGETFCCEMPAFASNVRRFSISDARRFAASELRSVAPFVWFAYQRYDGV